MRPARVSPGTRLVIMAKDPVAGRVKSRLSRDVGTITAACFFRANLALTIHRLGRDTRWETVLMVSPDTACASRLLPASVRRKAQGNGDLGQRMARAVLQLPPGPLVIIGADIPAIRSSDIARAFRSLNGADAVFGPCGDGGYWLVGLSRRARRRRIFDDVRWSTAFALADTRANLSGARIAEAGLKHDIDTGDDLARSRSLTGRLVVAP